MSQTMTAARLRLVLLISILLLIALMIGGFLLAQRNLAGYATTISQLNADAKSGDDSIRTLRELETRLNKEEVATEKAHNIVADSSTFADKVVKDITRIASQSGMAITSFEFVDTVAATAPVTTTPGAQVAAPAAPGGVTKKAVSVTLQSPVRYTNLMNFIKGIETNELKMQLATVSMTKGEGDSVGTQTLSIEAYVR